MRTGARHAEGRLSGLGSEHGSEEVSGPWAMELILSEKRNCKGKYIYPSHTFLTKFVSRGSTSLLEREAGSLSWVWWCVFVSGRDQVGGREGERMERGEERGKEGDVD